MQINSYLLTLQRLAQALCCGLSLAWAAFAQQATVELNITLGNQRVTFAPTRGFQEMRLEVVNSNGESVFAQFTTEASVAWNLRAGNGEALAPGLYRYRLILKTGEEQTTTHRGHFIVEQGQNQIWLTTGDGAEISGALLHGARTDGRSLAGMRLSEDSAQRDVSGRTIVDESGQLPTNDKKTGKLEKAALLGTVNMLAKFDGGGVNVIDSALIETGGSVGLGTTSPNAKLSVSANTVAPPGAPGIISYFANANESNTFLTADSYGSTNVHSDFLFRRARGTMAAPTAVQADDIIGQIQMRGYGATGFASTSRAGIRLTAAENWSDTAQGAYLAFMTTPKLSNAINVERMRITDAGNVGIGTTNPLVKLDVAGDLQVSGNIAAKYQDVAEWVPTRTPLSAGTVVSLDAAWRNAVVPSARAYDTHVAGVVSAQPGVILGESGAGKALVATTGRVKVKVDATRHPIKIGDLLVTSAKSGRAMKSKPINIGGGTRLHRPGTIIGKALEPLAQGRGEILVLLSLQ
jgi:hypothetical protein